MTDVTFSQDGTSIGYGLSNGKVGILSLKTKKKDFIMTTHSQGNRIVAVHFNMNDTLIASASVDGTICVNGVG